MQRQPPLSLSIIVFCLENTALKQLPTVQGKNENPQETPSENAKVESNPGVGQGLY